MNIRQSLKYLERASVILYVIVVIGFVLYTTYLSLVYVALKRQENEIIQLRARIDNINTTQIVQLHLNNAYNIKMDYNIVYDKFEVTGYAPSAGGINCSNNCDVTAIGFRVSAITTTNVTYCAVDPHYIPFGSIIIIQGISKPCVAVDTGGAIVGKRIDYMFNSEKEALKFGRKYRNVIILRKGGK